MVSIVALAISTVPIMTLLAEPVYSTSLNGRLPGEGVSQGIVTGYLLRRNGLRLFRLPFVDQDRNRPE